MSSYNSSDMHKVIMKRLYVLLFMLILSTVSYSDVLPVYPPTDKLPGQSEQVGVRVDHFPSILHAFIWRNWGLVPVARLA
jgi:hypothetical protein